MAELLKPVPQEDLKMMDQNEKSNASLSSVNQAIVVEDNPALDRKLLWKRDVVIIPVMGLLYSTCWNPVSLSGLCGVLVLFSGQA